MLGYIIIGIALFLLGFIMAKLTDFKEALARLNAAIEKIVAKPEVPDEVIADIDAATAAIEAKVAEGTE